MRALTAKTILLSNDDHNVLFCYRALLQEAGFRRVFAASTVRRTLWLADRYPPDLIITDLLKGRREMNGEQMGRIIKSRPLLSRVPILLLSGAPPWHPWDAAVFCAFVPIPIRANDFLRLVRAHLRGCPPLIRHRGARPDASLN